MREILFRGKRTDNGEWVYGYYIKATHHWHEKGIHEDWIVCGASQNGGWFTIQNRYAVISESVGQYTGLTDKNGKKIFEGDIVNEYDMSKKISNTGIVKWSNMFMGWHISQTRSMYCHECMSYEVIGNIHDNPELLEGNNE